MIGILAEKPSARRNIAKALAGKDDTFMGVYKGENFVIATARGHLYEFAGPEEQVPEEYKEQYSDWNIDNLPWDESLFAWKYIKKKDSDAVLKDIKKIMSKCDEICIATDNDPTGEGQLLAREIIDNLELPAKRYTRMYFLDESQKELQKAFVNRVELDLSDDRDYEKAFYRSQWDMLSMQFTRIATKCGDGRSTLRQGRLKSAMTFLVGDALKKLKEYKRIPFYQNRFYDENGVTYSNEDEPTFAKKEEVPNKYKPSAVKLVSKEIKKTAPPKMLDLAGLSAKLAPKGYKAKDVLSVYQKMYEKQIVSYPRTEDKVITPEQFNELLPLVDKIAAVVGVDTKILTHRTARKTHVKTDGAHGANRPGMNVPPSLESLSQFGSCAAAIYEILAKNYLATLAEDYEYEQQKGQLVSYPAFTGTASIPKVMGWKLVYNDEPEDKEPENEGKSASGTIPKYNGKGIGQNATPYIFEGYPTKPPTPTVNWLMKQLEKRDVGTGATRTSIFADVTSEAVKYPLIKETKGKLSLTLYGDMSYQLLIGTHIGSLDITEKLMGEMREIADKKLDPAKGLYRIRQLVEDDIETMKKNGEELKKNMPMENKIVPKYQGVWNGSPVEFKRVWSKHEFTDEECEKLCRGEEIIIDAISLKTGKPFKTAGKLDVQEWNGNMFVGFKSTGFVNQSGEKKKEGVPDMWAHHKFTDEEKQLLENGMAVRLDDCISAKGKKFSCKVRYGKKDNGYMGIIADFNI